MDRCGCCDPECVVPYALFENDERLTRPFRTEREVWEAAERADLVTIGTHGEKILDNDFEIKACEATPDELAAPHHEIVFTKSEREDTGRNGPPEPRPLPSQTKTREASS